MARPRKPIPKTQRQLSLEQQEAFKGIENRGDAGNPNLADGNFNANVQSTGIEFNRSQEMSFKDDDTKQYSVGIQDIDEAVFYYFRNVIKPFVIQNGVRREVPIIYGAPERWKSFQRDGYYRDKSNAIMLPIIVIKRDTITKDRSVANKLDANSPNLNGVWQSKFSADNFYDNFATLNNRKPVKTFYAVAQPDYVTMQYECLIQTYYMSQLNKIIEACEYASDAYWGNPERFKFRAFIDSFTTATELVQNQDRLVKGTFGIRLRGYIIPNTIQKELKSLKKYNSRSKITITNEVVRDMRDLNPLRDPTLDGRKRN
ncbi:MAG: hypothetical protein CMD20_00965 [Flavobacteriales bacterium]|nr:hypothetical protein [Flavobacteriales bacterium]